MYHHETVIERGSAMNNNNCGLIFQNRLKAPMNAQTKTVKSKKTFRLTKKAPKNL